jgi:transposase
VATGWVALQQVLFPPCSTPTGPIMSTQHRTLRLTHTLPPRLRPSHTLNQTRHRIHTLTTTNTRRTLRTLTHNNNTKHQHTHRQLHSTLMAGRPSKLTPQVHDKIITAIKAGNYLDTAARYAGVDPGTVHRWIAKGKDEQAPDEYRQFREAIESARAEAEARNVALIQQAANAGTWQAAAWYLERTAHQRWGRKQSLEVSGQGGEPVQVEVDTTALEAKVRALLGDSTPVDKTA